MTRERVTMAAAVAVHVLALAFLPRWHPAAAPSARDDTPVEVDLVATTHTGGEAHAGGERLARVPGLARPVRGDAHAPAWHTLVTPPGTTEVPTTPEDVTPPSVPMGSIGLTGLGSYRLDGFRTPSDTTELETGTASENERIAQNINHAIMDPIHAHEARNGTLADGPVVNELERTTRQLPGAPFEGRAILAFRIDELGLVVSATVEDSSGDRREWDEVAKATFNALAQTRVRLPSGSKGIAMRVEITAQVVLPSGARHPVSVGSPSVDALGHVLQGQFDRPAETPSIAAMTFDVSDIGAHPKRVASARVLSETAY